MMPSVSFLLPTSRLIVAMVAVHGTYSRQNTISEYAFIDHAEDVLCILSDEGLRAEAQAIHDGILEYFRTHEY